jgi:hypothetical protein
MRAIAQFGCRNNLIMSLPLAIGAIAYSLTKHYFGVSDHLWSALSTQPLLTRPLARSQSHPLSSPDLSAFLSAFICVYLRLENLKSGFLQETPCAYWTQRRMQISCPTPDEESPDALFSRQV